MLWTWSPKAAAYLAASPANNQLGHGFFQFSPEFYYRALSPPDAGFEIQVLVLVEQGALNSRWFYAVDPAKTGRRFQLRTSRPVEIMVAARRVATPVNGAESPQQSFYTAAWKSDGASRCVERPTIQPCSRTRC